MADNNYSNVIAPSDGVRRFLLKPSVMMLGLAFTVYSVFAFQMNAFEHERLGATLRSSLLYLAYFGVPLGILTSGIFARVRKMGMAYCMISLIVAALGALLLFLNTIAWLMREMSWMGMLGSGLELLTFALITAVGVNLVMSCMEFRIVPALGLAGVICTAAALIFTGIRVITSYSSMQFAWDSSFDWHNLAAQVQADRLQMHAKWIFRSIPMSDAAALKKMFTLRFGERAAVCFLYGVLALFFTDYYKEMKGFNRLISHASEYVDIPTARISESLARTEQMITQKLKPSGGSVKNRLQKLDEMTRAKAKGHNITALSEEFEAENDWNEPSRRGDRERNGGYDDDRPRRRQREEDSGYDDDRPRRRRREEDSGYDDDRPRRRKRREEEDELTEEERYIMEERRKRSEKQREATRRSKRTDTEPDYRQRRQERISRSESELQRDMNQYYDNYMQIREDRQRRDSSE